MVPFVLFVIVDVIIILFNPKFKLSYKIKHNGQVVEEVSASYGNSEIGGRIVTAIIGIALLVEIAIVF